MSAHIPILGLGLQGLGFGTTAGLALALALLTACGDAGDAAGDASGYEILGEETGAGGHPRRVRHTATGIVLRLVDPGSYTMGSPDSEPQRAKDEAQHAIVIEQPFYLGETEVTAAQWQAVMDEASGPPVEDELPVWPATDVTWYEAQRFVETLNGEHGDGWMLPSEAQWEYACRAGTTTPFSFGSTIAPEQVNYHGRYPYDGSPRGLVRDKPVAVASLPANAWGFHEMHGNVWEWCSDIYALDAADAPTEDDSSGSSRTLRGGSFSSSGKECRSAFREGYSPNSDGTKYGLRIARAVEALAP